MVEGRLLANGVSYRAAPDGTGLEVFADGLRNPFGLGFTPDGRLLAIDQGYDLRGSRPVANSPDPLGEIFPYQSATMKFDVSRSEAFGFAGQLFAAMFGTVAEATHPEPPITGFRVVRVDLEARQIQPFLVNLTPVG